MFHKIKDVNPMPDYRLSVQFAEGVTKVYDVKLLFERIDAFKVLKFVRNCFQMLRSISAVTESFGTMSLTCPATSFLKMGARLKPRLTV